MGAINWTQEIVAGGIGVAQRVAQDMDAQVVPARVLPFRTLADGVAAAATIGGLAMQSMGRNPQIGQALALSGTPMLVQAVWRAVTEWQTPTAGKTQYSPTNAVRARSAASRGTAGRYPAPTTQREFTNIRM